MNKKSLLMASGIFALLSTTLYAETNAELLKEFAMSKFKENGIEIKNLQVEAPNTLNGNWKQYPITFLVKENGNFVQTKETLIMNGHYLVSDALNLKTMTSIREENTRIFQNKFYNDDYLIIGNKNAKNKVVIFSDPLCPFCKNIVNALFTDAKQAKEKPAVYLYEIALKIHPASKILLQHIMASKNHIKAIKKVYAADVDGKFISVSDFTTINSWFKEKTGETITKDEIGKIHEISQVQHLADELGVDGTPTIFINGHQTKFLSKVEKLFK